ncbi:MAG: hypothetical protein ACYDD4_02000 [Acidimicrobiales bacterium]
MPGTQPPAVLSTMAGVDSDDDESSGAPRPGLRERLLLALPRMRHGDEKRPLGDRLRQAVLKPEPPGTAKPGPAAPPSEEEADAELRRADDKERLVGLMAAPIAGILSIVLTQSKIAGDPPQYLKSGALNPRYFSIGPYHVLELVLLALAVLMLVTAYWRKRLLLGLVTSLFGLSVFNLGLWGFGIPFLLVGAWLLVRTYRLQQQLRQARQHGPVPPRPGTQRPSPRPNKRYTPRS